MPDDIGRERRMGQPSDPVDRTEDQIREDERDAQPQSDQRRDDEAPAVRNSRIPDLGEPQFARQAQANQTQSTIKNQHDAGVGSATSAGAAGIWLAGIAAPKAFWGRKTLSAASTT